MVEVRLIGHPKKRLVALFAVVALLLPASLTKDGLGKGKSSATISVVGSHDVPFPTKGVGLFRSEGPSLKETFKTLGCDMVPGAFVVMQVSCLTALAFVGIGVILALVELAVRLNHKLYLCQAAAHTLATLFMLLLVTFGFRSWFKTDSCSLHNGRLVYKGMTPFHLWHTNYALFLYLATVLPCTMMICWTFPDDSSPASPDPVNEGTTLLQQAQ